MARLWLLNVSFQCRVVFTCEHVTRNSEASSFYTDVYVSTWSRVIYSLWGLVKTHRQYPVTHLGISEYFYLVLGILRVSILTAFQMETWKVCYTVAFSVVLVTLSLNCLTSSPTLPCRWTLRDPFLKTHRLIAAALFPAMSRPACCLPLIPQDLRR